MPATPFRSLYASALRWVRRAREQRWGGWERLTSLSARDSGVLAEELVSLRVLPHPHLPAPVPGWMSEVRRAPALTAGSSLWSTVSPQETNNFILDAQQAQSRAQSWKPWAWAWSQHPAGDQPWSEQLVWAWQSGDAALAEVLLEVFPRSVWKEGFESEHRWPWSTLWRRPVVPSPSPADIETPTGDWRHTLCLWEQVVQHLPSPHHALHAATTRPPLNVGQGSYLGTNADHYRWRAPQLTAWLRSGLPFPCADDVLWWMGLDWAVPNPWGEWFSEGFDPVRDRTAEEEQAWKSLQALEGMGRGLSPTLRQRLLLAWLADTRLDMGLAQGLDTPERVACEARWAQWLSSPFPPAPDEHGWAHAVARSKGVTSLRCRSLKKIWWSALPPAVFAQIKDGLLPWEALRDAPHPWSPPESIEIQGWLRRKASEHALDECLPAAVASESRRSRF